jgi:hypothetical protein
VSWEAKFPWTSGFSGWHSARLGDFGCVWVREAFSTVAEVSYLLSPTYFIAKDGLFTLRHTRNGQLSDECRKIFR